jgi:hypothetical protein
VIGKPSFDPEMIEIRVKKRSGAFRSSHVSSCVVLHSSLQFVPGARALG